MPPIKNISAILIALIFSVISAYFSFGAVQTATFVESEFRLVGGSCVNNSQCIVGICVNGSCVCANDDHCPAGLCIGQNCVDSFLFTPFDVYTEGVIMKISGFNFTRNGTTELVFLNGTDIAFNLTFLNDETGFFNHSFNTSGLNLGLYSLKAFDLNNSKLNKQKIINITGPLIVTGIIFDSAGNPVRSSVKIFNEQDELVTLDDEQYTLTIRLGEIFTAIVEPQDVAIRRVTLKFGRLGESPNILGVEDFPANIITPPFSGAVFKQAAAFFPNVPSFEAITPLEFIFSAPIAGINASIYKCAEWNFTSRSCAANFTQLLNLTQGQTSTELNFTPGDPALLIFDPVFEEPSTAPATGAGGGGGGGGGYIPEEARPKEEVELERIPIRNFIINYNQSYILGQDINLFVYDELNKTINNALAEITAPSKQFKMFSYFDGSISLELDDPGIWSVRFSRPGFINKTIGFRVIPPKKKILFIEYPIAVKEINLLAMIILLMAMFALYVTFIEMDKLRKRKNKGR